MHSLVQLSARFIEENDVQDCAILILLILSTSRQHRASQNTCKMSQKSRLKTWGLSKAWSLSSVLHNAKVHSLHQNDV